MKHQKCMGAKHRLLYEEIMCCVLNMFKNRVLARIFGCDREMFIGLRSFVAL
jgi:hypothetical protein